MKSFLKLAVVLCGTGIAFHSVPAIAEPPLAKEVAINTIYIPAEGYDDNDPTVDLMVTGLLPNACYREGRTEFTLEQTAEKQVITLKQFAIKNDDAICIESESTAFHNMVLPYSQKVSLGKLGAGPYTLKDANSQTTAEFTVDETQPSDGIDNMRYAAVSAVYVPSELAINAPAEAFVNGHLTSSCMNWVGAEVSLVENNVVVVKPLVAGPTNEICMPVLRPFHERISLDHLKLQKGEYLLHVRSMNGNSVNQIFSVGEAQQQ